MRASRAEPEPASAGGASPVLPARLAPAPPVITPWPRSVSARVSGNASAGRSRQRRPLRKVRSGIPARFESWAGVPPPRGEPEGPRPPGSWRHPTAGKAPVMTLQGQAPRCGTVRCRSDRRGPEVGAAPPTMGRGAPGRTGASPACSVPGDMPRSCEAPAAVTAGSADAKQQGRERTAKAAGPSPDRQPLAPGQPPTCARPTGRGRRWPPRRPPRARSSASSGTGLQNTPSFDLALGGASSGSRTHTSLRSTVFETAASAIPPCWPSRLVRRRECRGRAGSCR